MDIITAQQAAEELGVSRRRLLTLLLEGRVRGAHKLGRDWVIPHPVRLVPGSRGPEGAAGKRRPKE